MNKKLSLLATALVLTAASSQAEFSLQRGFDKTCESGATLLFGGLGLYFATKGLTIAQERYMSFQELREGRFIGSNFITRFIYRFNQDPAPKEARTNVLLSIANLALLTGLCIKNATTNT